MSKAALALMFSSFACAGVALAQQSAPPTNVPPATDLGAAFGIICQYVVSAEPGAKPQKLCLTRGEWEAKRLADSKDATRTVCRYQELSGTRFRSAKVCMPASQWEENRRIEREAVEAIQRSTCVPGAGC